MYILLNDNIVAEIIPDMNPDLPGVPIEERYPANFISHLIYVSDDTDVEQHYVYDPEAGTFSEPVLEEVSEAEESDQLREAVKNGIITAEQYFEITGKEYE